MRTKNEIFANQIGRFVGLSDRKHEIALFDIMGQSARVEFQQPRSLVPAYLKNKKRDTSWNILPCEYSKARPDCRTVVSMTNLEPLEPHKDRRAGLRADPETS